jgi:8-oxo-dGTP diphosphatase
MSRRHRGTGTLALGDPVSEVDRDTRLSFRLAAYAVCIGDGRVLLAHHVSPNGEATWTLPGGRVEHAEDPFDAVTREVAEETGYESLVERLLGVDSRVIRAAERLADGRAHQNVGVFYQVRITGGQLRPEPDGEVADSAWMPIPDVACLRRSSLVDIGLVMAQTLPPTGHVAPVPVGGLIQH